MEFYALEACEPARLAASPKASMIVSMSSRDISLAFSLEIIGHGTAEAAIGTCPVPPDGP